MERWGRRRARRVRVRVRGQDAARERAARERAARERAARERAARERAARWCGTRWRSWCGWSGPGRFRLVPYVRHRIPYVARSHPYLRPCLHGEHTPARPAPTSATDTVSGIHLAAYALGTGQGFVLGVAAPQRAPGDHTIASVAAVLLSLLTGEHQSRTGADRSSALVRLLLGAPPEDVASLLGGDRWLVVHALPDAAPPPPTPSPSPPWAPPWVPR